MPRHPDFLIIVACNDDGESIDCRISSWGFDKGKKKVADSFAEEVRQIIKDKIMVRKAVKAIKEALKDGNMAGSGDSKENT